ncbi:Leucine-rich repeat receptor-like protein kinase family [Zostera marina]|uniref:Cell wall hydroxyproline-rich glycoprotein n=1 Tax=Zostera marina TaxID=29655 RepID=A0A0K9PR87_ZOSMR|nr:Leucine-rich repeat receptor-like protein kinase family [Zostera marina]
MHSDFLLPPLLILFLSLCTVVSTARFGVWVGSGGGDNAAGSAPKFSTTTDHESYKALQTWKAYITEDPKGILWSWVGSDVCSYKRVFCSDPPEEDFSSGGQVVAVIDLNHANLKGRLVDDLSLLVHLSALHLNSNRFSGEIPNSLANLQYFTELDLSNNQFEGSFPTSILSIPNLAYLDLRFNRFVGSVPDALFQKDMDAIFLHDNMFDGQIPTTLWNSKASVVTLANNRFGGSFPSSFNSLNSGLRELLFSNNKLTGCIPEDIGFMTNMEVLDFSFNSFTGHLPTSISCLSDIQVFNIAHNQISGVLPDVVCSMRSLVNLTISFNFFSGFSHDCTKSFQGFDFSGNCVSGRGMQRPPPECASVPAGVQESCYKYRWLPSKHSSFSCSGPTSLTLPLPQIHIPLPPIKIPSIP